MKAFSFFIPTLLLLFLFEAALGQNYTIQRDYAWEADRKLMPLTEEQKKEDAIIIKEFKVFDYIAESGGLNLHYTHHKIVRVNNDKAIEEFNKVYIPIYGLNTAVNLTVRTIKANGEIVVLSGDKIKQLENVEDAGNFRIFAFEGVEPGCEVEYILQYTKAASIVGREFLQSDNASINTSVYVQIPDRFEFNAVFYNSNFSFTKKELNNFYQQNSYYTGEQKVDKLNEEQMAYYRSALARFDYSISVANNEGSKLDWEAIGEQVGKQFYPPSKETKKVKKILAELKVPAMPDEASKIRSIESYIKNTISINPSISGEETVSSILKNKFASESAITKLYAEFFRIAKIDYSIVLTTDRTRVNFDKENPSWLFLEETLFFFPGTGKFLTPTSPYYLYPMTPNSWADNYGLFIRMFHLNGMTTAKSTVQFIPPLSYESHYSHLDVKVKFDLDKDIALLDLTEKFSGEPGIYYQPFYGLVDDDKKKEIVNSVLKKPSEEGTPSEGVVVDYDRNTSPAIKPFVIKGKLSSGQLLQNAGKKYIFNVGDVIGPQSEWYVDTLKRKLPIQPRYGHYYLRQIEIVIPEGYQAKNLESINMDVTMGFKDDPKSCYFKSWYKQEGSIITVNIEEYYKLSEYPAEKYEPFRKVINAAADFNKVTILLEEK